MKNVNVRIAGILRFLPAFLIVSVSWHLSSQERVEHMPTFWNADKLVHSLCFAGLSFWIAFAFGTSSFRRAWIPFLATSIYGVVDEIRQSFTPGRTSSVFDWLADTAGGFLGACAFVLFVSIFLGKRREDERND